MGGSIIISGTIDQNKRNFEIEDLAGTETVANTVDAAHVAIVFDDGVDFTDERGLENLIHRMARQLFERDFVIPTTSPPTTLLTTTPPTTLLTTTPPTTLAPTTLATTSPP